MNDRTSKAIINFVNHLTGAADEEIRGYLTEINLNRNFHRGIDEKQNTSRRMRYYSWDISIGETLGIVLYAICRKQKPDIVIETGVNSGVSSSYILCALEENKRGQLHSIDLPRSQEQQSGWLIPDYLRHRWQLLVGKSSDKLVPLLDSVKECSIFFHDSDHSYKNMMWEFQTAWSCLTTGGLLLSHNISENNAFSNFCRDHEIKGYSLDDMGGLRKF